MLQNKERQGLNLLPTFYDLFQYALYRGFMKTTLNLLVQVHHCDLAKAQVFKEKKA